MSGKWDNPDIPKKDWECIDIKDYGKPVMTCQMCEREIIRYAHYMRHAKYKGIIIAGCICAGKMEGSSQKAAKRDSFMKSRMNKRKNWLGRKWKISKKGNQYIKSDGFVVVMKEKNGFWSAFVKSEDGSYEKWSTQKSKNENEIKLAAFDCLTNVLAEKEMRILGKDEAEFRIISNDEDNKNYDVSKVRSITSDVIKQKKEIIEIVTVDTEVKFKNEQLNIFEFIKTGKGHGIIDAVAGAGKTTTIMECAKYVPDKNDVLFCAFNKSIQMEIARKFKSLGLNQVTVKTIHALGYQMLTENNISGKKINIQEHKYKSLINDEKFQYEIRKHLEDYLDINDYEFNEKDSNNQFAIKDMVFKFKNHLFEINQKYRATLTPNNLKKFKELLEHFNIFNKTESNDKTFNKTAEIFFKCNQLLLNAGNELAKKSLVMDFTDMLYLPVEWELDASTTYSYLFIDECQDLSKAQLAIVLKYGKQDGKILAVGDPYQSIYGFAGADIDSFNQVRNTIKAKTLPLTTSFRCPPNIVALAAEIRHDITANKKVNGKIEEIPFKYVVNKAKENDLIISRYREPILFLVFEFINKDIQVQIHKDEVDEIIDELINLFKKEEREANISRIPGGLSKLTEMVFNRWNFIIDKEAKKISSSIERQIFLQSKRGYLNNKLDFISKKYFQWKSSCKTINDIMIKIKEYISASENCVKLSTIHRAKGLEADRVFILDFDEMPHYNSNQNPWEKVQELNLKYVAITRAKKELYLVQSKKAEQVKKDKSLYEKLRGKGKR